MKLDTSKFTYGTLNSRNTMSQADLKLMNEQLKYILKRISEGHLTKEQALRTEQAKIFKGGQFSFTRFLSLRDLLKVK